MNTLTLLTSLETASILRIDEKTLRMWRTKGDGPVWVKLGGRVVYKAADVEEFVNKHRMVWHG